ncbi:uncharacterized protein BDV14DRAFT_193947 [Aspergillus stella-maris]|uniref:uncharacterized protein n=1 Tax=Aspergillus stella-maris TaxID=1810926 RepID=UPI003CCCF4CF
MAGLEPTNRGKALYKCNLTMILGKAPIYRASDLMLHWVDCLANPPELHILQVNPDTRDAIEAAARVLKLEDSVTVQFFHKGKPGSYICAYYQGAAFLDKATGKLEIVKEIIKTKDYDKLCFNNSKANAAGRFWLAEINIKAMAYGPSKYDPDSSLHEIGSRFVYGNGLAWSPDNITMYVNDCVAIKVFKYDFDVSMDSFGKPDGMQFVDCNVDSNQVIVFLPQGRHLRDIIFSARNMACTTWGRRNLDVLFIATGKDRRSTAKDNQGGHMFKYRAVGTRGM